MRVQLVDIFHEFEAGVQISWRLLEERPEKACISHSAMPTPEQHRGFVAAAPYEAWYLIEIADDPNITLYAGAIYLTKPAKAGQAGDEIGVAILKKWQRQGLAKKAISELMRLHPRPAYYANIAPENRGSQKLFCDLGFGLVQYTYRLVQT